MPGKQEKLGMLDELNAWLNGGAAAAAVPARSRGVDVEERQADRFSLLGAEVYLFLQGDQRYRLRLRDLCKLGASGITDAPLCVGEQLVLQLEEMLMPAAEVIWTRCAAVGLAFINPLPLARLNRLRERHAAGVAWSPAMRAGSDLHGWWTDPAAHAKGRRPRLDAGGHDHPLPR
jgi:hypothetical protein